MVKHSVYGTFNTVSKITGAVGKGLAALSFDDDYIQKRQAKQFTEKPKHVGEGLLMGGKEFVTGIAQGVSGIVVQPYKGTKTEVKFLVVLMTLITMATDIGCKGIL